MIGTMITAKRKNHSTTLSDTWKKLASTSVELAAKSVNSSAKMATPAAVRLGLSRGRSSRLCSSVSPVILTSSAGHSMREREDEAGEHHGRQEDLERDGVAPDGQLPGRHDAQRAVEPAHVPVGLDGVGDLGRVVRAELPDRVDLGEGPEQRRGRRHHEEEAGGLGHEGREHRRADDVVLGPALALELRVLLAHQQAEVRREQPDQDERDDQDMDDEEARNDDARARELPAPQERHQVAADEGDRLGDGVADAQARCPRSGRRAASSR